MTRLTRLAQASAATVVAALALCAAATAGPGPVLSAGPGCSVSCIRSALVTPTASSASVEIVTSAPTSVTVKVAKRDAQPGLAGGPPSRDIVLPPFTTTRTVIVPGLEPETAYRIVVSARDVQGHVETRSGTFTTRTVKVAVDLPDVGLSSGLGCKADCLERGTLTSDGAVPGRARLSLESTVPATFQVLLVARRADGTPLHQAGYSTGSRTTSAATTFDGLLTGTRYSLIAKATDADGRTWSETGTFRTRSAVATVTYHRLVVLEDGDRVGRGELAFDFRAGDTFLRTFDHRRLGSGDTFVPRMPGTTRPGLWTTLPVDGLRELRLSVGGDECDGHVLAKCAVEAGWFPTSAETTLDLRDAFVGNGVLPPGFGGQLPAGHDAYAVFASDGGAFRVRVYATVDVHVA